MARCINCGTNIGKEVEVCPICEAGQVRSYNPGIDNVDRQLTSSPSLLFGDRFSDNQEYIENEKKEIARLIKRGDECFNSGKAWIGAKDRSRARKEFQRAFNYFETVLKMDPDNEIAREARARCLFKMA